MLQKALFAGLTVSLLAASQAIRCNRHALAKQLSSPGTVWQLHWEPQALPLQAHQH